MSNINPISAVLFIIFAVPIITGTVMQFTREGVRLSLWSWFDNITFLVGVVLSIYLTRKIFFDHTGGWSEQIYNLIPKNLQTVLYGQDVLIYLAAIPIILLLILTVLRLFYGMLNRIIIYPLADGLYSLLASGGQVLRSMLGALIQVPRSAFLVFLVGMGLNFFAYYYPSPVLSGWMHNSDLYQVIYQKALCPVLNSNLAKKIPVLFNDSFAGTLDKIGSDAASGVQSNQQSRNGLVIKYFNGVTLDQAVKSDPEIDETARELVQNETNSTRKAYLLYRWVAVNINYDSAKAVRISKDPSGIASGSIIAFNTRKGICFDYSSLYVSMCRAAGLKVRLITGVAYSGTSWGDHAWNQVYSPDAGRWINVDTTFGHSGNYFDKADFSADHKLAEIQGEW